MIKVFKISTFIFVLTILCAPSCEDEQEIAKREDATLAAATEDIRIEFETDYLNEASLFAYEITAKQKLSDFSDYLQIMTDTSLDMSFRIKASEMIKSAFISEDVVLQLTDPNMGRAEGLEAKLIIKNGLEDKLALLPFSFDSISVFEPFSRIDNSTYSGVLCFSQNFIDPAYPGQTVKSIKKYNDIYVLKKPKVFGKDTMMIWNVRLGEIR